MGLLLPGDDPSEHARQHGHAHLPVAPADNGGAGADAATSGVLTEIDHVGMAVRDLDTTVDWYRTTFGATVSHRERIETDGVEEALIKVADSYLQLLTPYTDTSPLAKYMERNGEGIHHVGYRVADCSAVLEQVKQTGARVVDEHPRTGSRGTTVAFLHPKSSFGSLIELVEE
ncbi:MAG TPA: methylmalonyl-CoA epimerase [Acidimicrobiales bacterium]|nr:methylmalonyl-CoA epimerase [Acidimicrobiales bacterium]